MEVGLTEAFETTHVRNPIVWGRTPGSPRDTVPPGVVLLSLIQLLKNPRGSLPAWWALVGPRAGASRAGGATRPPHHLLSN